MTRPEEEIVTEVPNVTSLRELSNIADSDTQKILKQIERPRVNLGGTGPPGRTD